MNTEPPPDDHMSSDEVELNSRETYWIKRARDTKIGDAVLTSQRLLFYDKKFVMANPSGALGSLIADGVDHLRKPKEAAGPKLELPLASITEVKRDKKLLNKDRIALSTADEVYLFSDGWKTWSPLLREALTTTHGRRIVDQGEDSWRVAAD